jgi:hypothetical protein
MKKPAAGHYDLHFVAADDFPGALS